MEEGGPWNHLTAIAVSALQSSVHLGVNYQYHWVVITVQCYSWIMVLYSLFKVICFLLPPSWHTGSTCDYIPPDVEIVNGAPAISWRAIVYIYIVRLRVILIYTIVFALLDFELLNLRDLVRDCRFTQFASRLLNLYY